MADADSLIRLEPNNSHAFYTKGVVYMRFNKPDSALLCFDKSININPNSEATLNNRGSLLFNSFQRYNEALVDFTKAIELNPQGEYFYHRSLCYFKMGDIERARTDVQQAIQKGITVPNDYKVMLKLP
jgi:tetratricopeptide (TPR) repeat protein